MKALVQTLLSDAVCWLGVWTVGGLLLVGCQMGTEPVAAASSLSSKAASGLVVPRVAAAGLPNDSAGPAVAAPPDSLALTPVPMPFGVPPALSQVISQLHAALGPAAADLRPAVLAVADLDLPNTTPRLWVVDIAHQKVLHRSLVAHGRGSGQLRARCFSSQLHSACSALGFYRTLATYDGKHGLSRRLRGLDSGQNSSAEDRCVVLHGAPYVSPEYVAAHGHLGYSRGCPALPPAQYAAIIQALPVGHVLLLSGPGFTSRWLDGVKAGQQFAARGWE